MVILKSVFSVSPIHNLYILMRINRDLLEPQGSTDGIILWLFILHI